MKIANAAGRSPLASCVVPSTRRLGTHRSERRHHTAAAFGHLFVGDLVVPGVQRESSIAGKLHDAIEIKARNLDAADRRNALNQVTDVGWPEREPG